MGHESGLQNGEVPHLSAARGEKTGQQHQENGMLALHVNQQQPTVRRPALRRLFDAPLSAGGEQRAQAQCAGA